MIDNRYAFLRNIFFVFAAISCLVLFSDIAEHGYSALRYWGHGCAFGINLMFYLYVSLSRKGN